jgi:hypothetical protein
MLHTASGWWRGAASRSNFALHNSTRCGLNDFIELCQTLSLSPPPPETFFREWQVFKKIRELIAMHHYCHSWMVIYKIASWNSARSNTWACNTSKTYLDDFVDVKQHLRMRFYYRCHTWNDYFSSLKKVSINGSQINWWSANQRII